MIVLNGKKFAETNAEFKDSLFESGGTCVGYAKRMDTMIWLMDHNRIKIGQIDYSGVLWGVDVDADGDILCWRHGGIDLLGVWESYSARHDEIESLVVCRKMSRGVMKNYYR